MAQAVVAPTLLDNELQSAIQNYLDQNHTALQISAVQMSVLLPTQSTPRDYVVGTQYYDDPATPATTGMMVQWGSITKEYTDALIFQLVNQGKINTNDTLMQLLPEEFTQDNSNAWPSAWANVTLIQLMNMTSGVTNYTSIPNFLPGGMAPGQYSLQYLVNQAAQYQKQNGCSANLGCFTPGAQWFYSNTNYLILGLVVEKLTGLSFTNAINQNILEPFQNQGDALGYYASTYPDNILANMIHGYYSPPGSLEPQDISDWNMSWAASAGAMIGTTDALVKITNALYHNEINPSNNVFINELQQNLVQVPSGLPATNIETQCILSSNLHDQNGSCYAMGLAASYDPMQKQTIWWYQGGTLGYATLYVWFPSEKVIIAISQNSNGNDYLLQLTLRTINPMIQKYLLSQ